MIAAMSDTILDRLAHDGVLAENTESATITLIRSEPLHINAAVGDARTARAVVETLTDERPGCHHKFDARTTTSVTVGDGGVNIAQPSSDLAATSPDDFKRKLEGLKKVGA